MTFYLNLRIAKTERSDGRDWFRATFMFRPYSYHGEKQKASCLE
jgi:hypothetical protein